MAYGNGQYVVVANMSKTGAPGAQAPTTDVLGMYLAGPLPFRVRAAWAQAMASGAAGVTSQALPINLYRYCGHVPPSTPAIAAASNLIDGFSLPTAFIGDTMPSKNLCVKWFTTGAPTSYIIKAGQGVIFHATAAAAATCALGLVVGLVIEEAGGYELPTNVSGLTTSVV